MIKMTLKENAAFSRFCNCLLEMILRYRTENQNEIQETAPYHQNTQN